MHKFAVALYEFRHRVENIQCHYDLLPNFFLSMGGANNVLLLTFF